ncbi:orotidine-5'-phosphate decarboxylase [Buchnera aphidicola]|uniref:Orotidine 5'-phosphate decarboxylase n=1 Tax=Buchnera aphidicola (Sarucallis kahawaluokalani) TaxID=1241878 RepID=A0A4D6YDS1_9GAMM|nr:orotidine-5'-phosphate decarboxylase [Buchnera aphidicola]QCI26193.1 orotidine-5'-phosphate decarboxylase [Buchnera aphidicola (Sarucallis kahawaluokalani)]
MISENLKNPEIIIALDYVDKKSVFNLIDKIDPKLFKLKIGHSMFIKFGIELIKEIKRLKFDIFLDLKLYDIPNIMFKSISIISELGIWMTSVHASGSGNVMEYAKLALRNFNKPPLLIAITTLTSFSECDLYQIGIKNSLPKYILQLAKLTKLYQLDGVVCPGFIAKKIKKNFGNDFKVVVPGIRFINHNPHDQNFVTYIEEIKKYHMDYIVIGRTITTSSNPVKDLYRIWNYVNTR